MKTPPNPDSSSNEAKTLLIVDNHPVELEGLLSVLTGMGYNVMIAENATNALRIAERIKKIDVFIIDLSLIAHNDGLDLVKKLRELGNKSQVSYRSPAFESRRKEAARGKRKLSPLDLKVLDMISNGHTTKEVAEANNISSKTVEYHRACIIRKLEVRNMAAAISTAVRLGIV